MNTTDIKVNGFIKNFNDLYIKAKEQFLMYEKLEGVDSWEAYDFCIDCSEDQAKFKDMLQIRFIEELTEATKTLYHIDHLKEELTDSLNFFLSAYIMIGVNFNNFMDPDKIFLSTKIGFKFNDKKEIFAETYRVVEAVGYLCNLLKNRPWAQSNYLVSMLDFSNRLSELWEIFWGYLFKWGLTPEMIFEMFERKFEVNKFRIQTGY